MIDVLDGLTEIPHILLGDQNCFVRVVDCMPRLVPEGCTADYAIVQAARTSYGQGTKKVNEDRGLIRYLLRHRHTSPFEMVRLKFHLRMPIFVYRQIFRHRTADICGLDVESELTRFRKFITMNEYSARYSEVPDAAFVPEFRLQSKLNKQGGDEPAPADVNEKFQLEFAAAWNLCYNTYRGALSSGISRELARTVLPVGSYTEFYLNVDLWNLMHFLHLRCDRHTQLETREYANLMAYFVEKIFPVSYEAWLDYIYGSSTLSRQEMAVLRLLLNQKQLEETGRSVGLTARELAEFIDKFNHEVKAPGKD